MDNVDKLRAYEKTRSSSPDRVAARKAYVGTDAGKASHNRATAKWRKDNPIKDKAHHLVAKALHSGELVQQPCRVCGTTNQVQAHHEDYSRPLAVDWLCAKHHKEVHNSKMLYPDVAGDWDDDIPFRPSACSTHQGKRIHFTDANTIPF